MLKLVCNKWVDPGVLVLLFKFCLYFCPSENFILRLSLSVHIIVKLAQRQLQAKVIFTDQDCRGEKILRLLPSICNHQPKRTLIGLFRSHAPLNQSLNLLISQVRSYLTPKKEDGSSLDFQSYQSYQKEDLQGRKNLTDNHTIVERLNFPTTFLCRTY